MTDVESGVEKSRFVIVFTGGEGYHADAIAYLVAELEGRGHSVELVSYGGLAAQTAKSIAERGMRGIRAAVKHVTGKLTGEDPLGLAESRARADAVIVTSPELVSATKAMAGTGTVRLGLMMDLDWNSAWTDTDAHGLIVPHTVFKELATRRGWSEQSLFVAGVPLPKNFSRPLDIAAIRSRFKIDDTMGALVLVIAEGVEEARLERTVFQLSLVDHPIQPIFYVGEDSRAAEVLRRAAGEYGVMARMFGRVDNLEEYYAACELVLAKVSNPMVYALLSLDKPMVLIDSDSDTRPVGAFLHDESAAVVVPDILKLGAEIDHILGNPGLLEELREGARKVVDQAGVQKTVEALEAALKAKETLLHPKSTASSGPDPLTGGGAFEVIGGIECAPKPQGSEKETDRAAAFESHSASRLTAAEAKEELAALILQEREVEKRLGDATRYVGQWEGRLDLAKRAGEPDLTQEATRFLENFRREETSLLRELDRIRSQKDKLKRRVTPRNAVMPSDPQAESRSVDLEKRFRSMELDHDVNRLKNRLKDEFGDS